MKYEPPLGNLFHCLTAHGKEIFSYVQSELPLVQLYAISTCPVIGYQGEATSTSVTASSPGEVAESNEANSQLFLVRHACQPFYQLCCPQDVFKDLNILFILQSPELHMVFQVRLHQR